MDLHIELPGLHLKNPTIPAGGYLGFGRESTELYDLSLLEDIVTKSATPHSRFENLTPCVTGTPYGMLGATSPQDPGVDVIIEQGLPWLVQFDTEIIANMTGANGEEYAEVITRPNKNEVVKTYELNISCPDVKYGGIGLDTDPKLAASVTRTAKEAAEKPVYVKLSPNIINIAGIVEVVEEVGADGLVLINTPMRMHMDLHTGKPLLTDITGGLSDPTIKSVAVRMVHQVVFAVNIPIIGAGGITRTEDVLKFLYAGTSAVKVEMQNLIDPLCCVKVIEGLSKVLKRHGNNSLNDAAGRSFR